MWGRRGRVVALISAVKSANLLACLHARIIGTMLRSPTRCEGPSTEPTRDAKQARMTGADAMPRDERLLLTGVAVDAFGTGLTVPFLVVYLHGVRGLPLETVGLIVAVPA